MSKDSFKVKKGITLNPVDPADITNPEAGDLIADSTDDNKIKKYDADSSDWTSVGGSAGIGGNLMPEFEKLTPTLSNVTSATDTVTFLPVDDNNKSIKATWSGSVGSIQYQVALDSSLQEIQGTVSVWIRTSLDNIQVSSVQDGVKISTLPVYGTDKWKQYEIPMVLGGSNVGFIVESLTGVTGDVFIDVPFVGLTPSSYAFEVAQSEHAFDVNIGGAGTTTFSAIASSYTEITNSGLDMVVNQGSNLEIPCSGTNPSTGLTCSTGNESVGVAFDAKVGTYEICMSFGMYQDGSASYTAMQLVETPNNAQTILQEGGSRVESGGGSTPNTYPWNICGTFYFDTSGKKTIRLMYEKNTSTTAQILTDRLSTLGQRDIHITGKYYPPKSSIVTQVQELTAETANQWNASFTSTHTLVSEDFDGVINCVNNGTGDVLCTWPTQTLTEAPTVDCTPFNDPIISDSITCTVREVSTTQARLRLFDANNNSFRDIGYKITVNKSGADYNKSAMIVGNFEQIKSLETPYVYAEGNNGASITANTDINFTEVEDASGLWTSNTTYSPNEDGWYFITGSTSATSSHTGTFYIHDGTANIHYLAPNNLSATIKPFQGIVYLEAAKSYTFRATTTFTLNNTPVAHRIYIQKWVDTGTLIKNLNDNRNVKCQTKYLSANQSTDGTMSDLTFNNLVIGKKYQVNLNMSARTNIASNDRMSAQSINDGNTVCFYGAGGANGSWHIFTRSCKFTATATTLTHIADSVSSGNNFSGNGTISTSYVELCELPDNYIETDEW